MIIVHLIYLKHMLVQTVSMIYSRNKLCHVLV